MMKKIGFFILIGCMILAFAGCGGKSGGGSTGGSKDYVYKTETVSLNRGEVNRINDFYVKDGRMYLSIIEWLEEGSKVTLMSQGLDGSDAKSCAVDMNANSYLSYLNSDEQGNFYFIYNEYIEEGENKEDYNYREECCLMKVDEEGKEIWRQRLNEDGQDYWVMWMHLFADGRIGVADQEGISFYDTDGNPAGYITPKEELSGGAYFMADGTVVLGTYNEKKEKSVLRRLNLETGEYSEEYEVPGNADYSLYPGVNSDFLLVKSGGVYSYNLGDSDIKKLMDFIDSDLSASYLYGLCDISGTEFYAMMNDVITGADVLTKFTKVDPKDVPDKKMLTLACVYTDWEVRRHVVEFNKTNPEYRIQITEYSQYNTEDDYSLGITKLNTDIVSGKMPDILLLNDNLPIESYMAKGLFEDLYPYIDKDGEMGREDFFQNVLKACENDGKLYFMAPQFMIFTVTGKTADVGKRDGWTLQDLQDVMASKPEGMEIFSEMTRDSMLYYSMQMSGGEFVDWESGKCNFNSEGFMALLEFVKQFPESLPEDYYDNAARGNWNSWFRKGTVLLDRTVLDGFYSYNYAKRGTFGEDITLIGFPCESRQGSAISLDLRLAMSAKSKNKDGAWQFLRYFLTDEFQGEIAYGWPMRIDCVNALAERAKNRPFYEDENGNKVEYDNTYYIDDMEIVIPPMTQEEVDELLGFVKSVDRLLLIDYDLFNIVSEEAAPYFDGQKNVKEVADIIQNRVQIYVSENS